MSCVICKGENLYPSSFLTIEERRGVLEDIQNFELCRGCGNVMMRTTRGDIVGTDHIRDTDVIKLAYKKLFGTSFNGTPPRSYGFTRDGERFPTSNLEAHLPKEEPVALDQPIDYVSLDEHVENAKTVDKSVEESYTHVDNSNIHVGFFGKIKQFVKNLFSKAS